MNVEFKTICDTCNAEVEVILDMTHTGYEINIVPCKSCMDDKYAEGHADGEAAANEGRE